MPFSLKNTVIAGIVKIALLGIGTAHAAGSGGHSVEAVDRSGAAVSHGAAAVASGAATAVHNLYQRADDLDVSDLVQDYPADSFAGAYSLDAGVIAPDRRLQAKLLDVIDAPT